MKQALAILFAIAAFAPQRAICSGDSTAAWSGRIAEAFLARHPGAVTYDTGSPNQKWNYEQGLMLQALERMYRHTGEERYIDFVRKNLEQYVGSDGTIRTYRQDDYNLDNIAAGPALLAVFRMTKDDRYRIAAEALRGQLRDQPRTLEGGFWHKKIYPNQMWLDGLFMAEPFYARYAAMFSDKRAFDDIARQFMLIARHTRDSKTGLLYHGWDEHRLERWADSVTGCSRSFWGRATGWYIMALVDVLDDVPPDHPMRRDLEGILRDLADALVRVRDARTSLYYQVLDQPGREGNYLEASASCMVAYSLAKGSRKGYLGAKFSTSARETFNGVIENFVTVGPDGRIDLAGTCRSAGLGGSPDRDGSYEYYVSEGRRTNDFKGLGAFLLAAIELEESNK
jgi:unsaturated rhamnogalacturonyl hydrolase